MNKFSFPFFVLLLLIPNISSAQTMRTVTQVIYGDTLQLDGTETVRLIGVWAPKQKPDKKPDKVMQGWQDRATQFTQGMVGGKQVWLQYDDQHRTDDQGRTLAYVFFKTDGVHNMGGGGQKVLMTSGTYMLNRLLVNYGFADTESKFSFPYRAEFEQLENEAQAMRKGLFMDGVNPF